jgi:outer membrane protein assembly factor BamA
MLFVALLLSTSRLLMAQDEVSEVESRKRNRKIVPFPVLFFSPETGVAFGAGGLYLVSPRPEAVVQEPDTINALGFYTTKNQLLLTVQMDTYFTRSGDNLNFQAVLQKFPDKFWGIGPDTPDAAEEDFTPQEFAFILGYQWRLSRTIYLGPEYGFSTITTREVEEGGLLDSGDIVGKDGTLVSAIGLRFSVDDRDSRIYTRRGYLAELRILPAARFIGSRENFIQIDFDYRHFFPLFQSHVAALQYILRVRTGTIPFQFLPKLGGQYMMRGYYEGRYRDANYSALQGEYRFPLFWRLGGVVFGSFGKVGSDIPSLFSTEYLRASGGIGLRFLMNDEENVNFRLDLAYNGREAVFYFNILEAF